RPLVRFAGEARLPDQRLTCLLHIVGGHVTIEGLEFDLDPLVAEPPIAAIRVEDTELTLRGCSFRRADSPGREVRDVAALQVRTAAARRPEGGGERPPAVFADSCHFDGGQLVLWAEGPADVGFRDCTMGPARPSIWFDNAR